MKRYISAKISNPSLKLGHWYKYNDRGEIYIGQYVGEDDNFPCCVCDKGCKAAVFNVFYDDNGYMSFGYGPNHMPKILEDMGEQDNVIIWE